MAITKFDQFDFLIDIVPRDDIKQNKPREEVTKTTTNPDQVGFTLLYKFLIKIGCDFVRNNNFNEKCVPRKCLNIKEFEMDSHGAWTKHWSLNRHNVRT